MCSCCYGESPAVSVPGTNCSKSFLVSALPSAFISQFLAKACGLQIKMSNSRCAAEHTDPGHHAAPCRAPCLRLPALGSFRRGREAATLTKLFCVFYSQREHVFIAENLENLESTDNINTHLVNTS